MAYSFSSAYGIPATGLRFFTVYGPFGRPDMAIFKFTKSILEKKTINLYNQGKNIRDFTYIDDVSKGVINIINKPSKNHIPYQIFNIGSGKSLSNLKLMKLIERNLKKKSVFLHMIVRLTKIQSFAQYFDDGVYFSQMNYIIQSV